VQIDQNYIEKLISEKTEESKTLEFKSSGALDFSKSENKGELVKDISSFANGDGGIIIYGILEENHVASKLSFVDGKKTQKETIEQIINSGIPTLKGQFEIIPIRFDSDIGKSVYVIKILQSPNRPHMTSSNKFYKRHNFLSMAMDEQEVKHIFLELRNQELVALIKPNIIAGIESILYYTSLIIVNHKEPKFIKSENKEDYLSQENIKKFSEVDFRNPDPYTGTSMGNLAQQVGLGMQRTHQNLESIFMKYGTLLDLSIIVHYEKLCSNIVFQSLKGIIEIYNQMMSFQNSAIISNPTFPKNGMPITISLAYEELEPAFINYINELFELKRICITSTKSHGLNNHNRKARIS
jgi:hypothetical protein